MFMIRVVTTATAALLAACASQPATSSEAQATDSQVFFSSKQDKSKFTIECSPRSKAIANNPSWVDACNALGRVAIDEAVRQRLIAPVAGPAFGMASEFMKQTTSDLPIASKALSRDWPLTTTPL